MGPPALRVQRRDGLCVRLGGFSIPHAVTGSSEPPPFRNSSGTQKPLSRRNPRVGPLSRRAQTPPHRRSGLPCLRSLAARPQERRRTLPAFRSLAQCRSARPPDSLGHWRSPEVQASTTLRNSL